MESINDTIEKALDFLSDVQNACDSKRSHIEQYSCKCYSIYLKEWKAEQKRIERELEKEHKPNDSIKEEGRAGSLLTEGLEELSIADSLLEKARAIRYKSKTLSKQIAELENSSFSETIDGVHKSNVSAGSHKTFRKDIVKGLKKNHTVLPHSKSALNYVPLKSSKMPHSKSMNDYVLKKDIIVPNNRSSLKKKATQSSVQYKDRTLNDSEVGIISSKQFNDFKCISVKENLSESQQKEEIKNTETRREILNSDSPQIAFHHSSLSYQSFRNNLRTGTLNLKSPFQLQKDGFWYPFISFNNKNYLFEWAKCNTFESFMKVVRLLHKIQEMMLWIDLLSVVGKEMLPSLMILDENDKNVVRLCSYLSSIYHESLQRIPMLNFD